MIECYLLVSILTNKPSCVLGSFLTKSILQFLADKTLRPLPHSPASLCALPFQKCLLDKVNISVNILEKQYLSMPSTTGMLHITDPLPLYSIHCLSCKDLEKFWS